MSIPRVSNNAGNWNSFLLPLISNYQGSITVNHVQRKTNFLKKGKKKWLHVYEIALLLWHSYSSVNFRSYHREILMLCTALSLLIAGKFVSQLEQTWESSSLDNFSTKSFRITSKMAALDSAAEISSLMDQWKKDEDEGLSPNESLNRYRWILVNIFIKASIF